MNKHGEIKDSRPFAEKHPHLYFLIGSLMLLGSIVSAVTIVAYVIKILGDKISTFIERISTVASNLDAVVIVALITGAVSIFGVMISSIVAKSLDYSKARQEYLAQKREKPYADFIKMYYKILMSKKLGEKYNQDDMLKDMTEFSQQLTLWGSNKVVKLWVDYRTKATQTTGVDNLLEFEKILYEIRKDMGFRKMKKGTLLKFVVNDLDESLKKMKK